jgi:hypothetical protein
MRQSVIVISRCEGGDVERRAFERAVIRRLGEDAGPTVLVLPSVYSMSDSHAALSALKEIPDDLVFASWLHPRASYWLLRSRGINWGQSPIICLDAKPNPPEQIIGDCPQLMHAFHLAAFPSPEACAEALLRAAGTPHPHGAPSPREIEGDAAPRWYPVLDGSACVACRQCYDFCLFGVYTLDGNGRPVVTSPDRCKPGCAACARICPEAAILFPLYEADEGIAGAPGKRPAAAPLNPEAFFARSGEPCPLCGCACDCERWTGGPRPVGKTVCPACGCICDVSRPCASKENLDARPSPGAARTKTPDTGAAHERDDLDGLIDALDELDV